jgi:hypothetical protein
VKYMGLVSLLAFPVGVLLGVVFLAVSTARKDTSGLAGLGAGVPVALGGVAGSAVGIVTGIIALRSGTGRVFASLGILIGLIVVGGILWVVLRDR